MHEIDEINKLQIKIRTLMQDATQMKSEMITLDHEKRNTNKLVQDLVAQTKLICQNYANLEIDIEKYCPLKCPEDDCNKIISGWLSLRGDYEKLEKAADLLYKPPKSKLCRFVPPKGSGMIGLSSFKLSPETTNGQCETEPKSKSCEPEPGPFYLAAWAPDRPDDFNR